MRPNGTQLIKETKVQTATGWTVVRQLGSVLLTQEDVQEIIPLGLLTQLGLKANWERDGCHVMHPKWGRIPVWVSNNCPYVDKVWGKRLMSQIESEFDMTCGGLRKLSSGEPMAVSVEKLREWFPQAPESQLQRLCVGTKVDVEALPYNRHKRRRIAKAKWVMLNLFTGSNP